MTEPVAAVPPGGLRQADGSILCPHCRAELRHACAECGKLVDLRWEVCAFCGKPGHGRLSVPIAFDRAHWELSTLDGVSVHQPDAMRTSGTAAASGDMMDSRALSLNSTSPQSNGVQLDELATRQPARSGPVRDPDLE
jgi:hypothetical protein